MPVSSNLFPATEDAWIQKAQSQIIPSDWMKVRIQWRIQFHTWYFNESFLSFWLGNWVHWRLCNSAVKRLTARVPRWTSAFQMHIILYQMKQLPQKNDCKKSITVNTINQFLTHSHQVWFFVCFKGFTRLKRKHMKAKEKYSCSRNSAQSQLPEIQQIIPLKKKKHI